MRLAVAHQHHRAPGGEPASPGVPPAGEGKPGWGGARPGAGLPPGGGPANIRLNVINAGERLRGASAQTILDTFTKT
ncbi:hypothetical protein ACFVZ2_34695, partial [Streptomyces lasiicapitis]